MENQNDLAEMPLLAVAVGLPVYIDCWLRYKRRERTSFGTKYCIYMYILFFRVLFVQPRILPESDPDEWSIVSGRASNLIQLVRQCPRGFGFRVLGI